MASCIKVKKQCILVYACMRMYVWISVFVLYLFIAFKSTQTCLANKCTLLLWPDLQNYSWGHDENLKFQTWNGKFFQILAFVGWSVEWDASPVNDGNVEWCYVWALPWCHLELSFIFRCTCSEVFVMNLNLVCNNN